MTTITSATALANASAPSSATANSTGRSYGDLGQADFFRLLTVQIQQQDPLDPVDNKEMLAQMAQFTSLSGINNMGDTLKEISAKLDRLGSFEAGKTLTNTSKTEQ